jgi:urease alpha subunit
LTKLHDINISSIDFSIAQKMSRVGAIRCHIWRRGGDEKRRFKVHNVIWNFYLLEGACKNIS